MIFAIIIVLLRDGNRINTLQVILFPSTTVKFIFFEIFLLSIRVFYELPDCSGRTVIIIINILSKNGETTRKFW